MSGAIPMIASVNERTACPTCGMAVRIVRRVDGSADHYEAMIGDTELHYNLKPQDPVTAERLRQLRAGKKTVAVVGMAETSCSLAPFDDEDVEIWGLNEAHAFPWMKRANRWFQIHNSESWKRYMAKREILGHFNWLKKNPWNIPIYMQFAQEIIPNSVSYPLHDVVDKVFKNFRRGEDKVKYFTSTFAYMMGVAVLEDFKRIEIYGFEMGDDVEYVKQKACAEFWIGYAVAKDIEVYTPPGNQILWSGLYGGNEQGEGWLQNV